ncbi:MAG TPA: hypothetical protein VF348_08525, partial [Usitatibacter sp.]
MALARRLAALVALLSLSAALCAQPRPLDTYWPGTRWEHRTPEESGMDAARLKDAIDFAIAAES